MSGKGRGARKDKRKLSNTSPTKVNSETTPKTRRTLTGKLKMASNDPGKNEGDPGEKSASTKPNEQKDITDLDPSTTTGLTTFDALRDSIMCGINKRLDEQDSRNETRLSTHAQSIATSITTFQADIKLKFTNYDTAQKELTTRSDKMDANMSSLQSLMTTHTSTVSSLSSEFKTMQHNISIDLANLRAQATKTPPPRILGILGPRSLERGHPDLHQRHQVSSTCPFR